MCKYSSLCCLNAYTLEGCPIATTRLESLRKFAYRCQPDSAMARESFWRIAHRASRIAHRASRIKPSCLREHAVLIWGSKTKSAFLGRKQKLRAGDLNRWSWDVGRRAESARARVLAS